MRSYEYLLVLPGWLPLAAIALSFSCCDVCQQTFLLLCSLMICEYLLLR